MAMTNPDNQSEAATLFTGVEAPTPGEPAGQEECTHHTHTGPEQKDDAEQGQVEPAPCRRRRPRASTILARTANQTRVLGQLVRWTIEPVRQRADDHHDRQGEREEPEEDLHRQPTGNQTAGEGLVPLIEVVCHPDAGTSLSLGLEALECRGLQDGVSLLEPLDPPWRGFLGVARCGESAIR